MHLEEICLSTSEVDPEVDQPLAAAEKMIVLEQANWLRHCVSKFTLFSNHRLSVETHRFMQDCRDYTLDIRILDPHPKRKFKVGWGYLLISFALFCAAALFASGSLMLNSMLLTVSLVAFAGLTLMLAVYRSHDRIVFYSQSGRIPLVVLVNRLPDKVTLDTFTDVLVENINNAKNHNQDTNEVLNEELKEHRRLMEEGIISGKRYDIVKQRILRQHS